jgi:membrane protein YqaA with SNARE-associated domain
VNLLIQTPRRGSSLTSTLAHLGAGGLFILAIVDSSPLPTFAGPDILTAILAAKNRDLWYEYAIFATLGSVIGAYLTFRIARKAGQAYIDRKFKKGKLSSITKVFNHSGAGALFASCAIPFPFPTSVLFAAAGVSDYKRSKFLSIVAVGRGIRYTAVALIAEYYGRHIVRVLRHPGQYWGWSVLFAAIVVALIVGGILLNRRLATESAQSPVAS